MKFPFRVEIESFKTAYVDELPSAASLTASKTCTCVSAEGGTGLVAADPAG